MAEPQTSIPPLSLVLGLGPALLVPLAAAGAWLLPHPYDVLALAFGQLWAAAILLFLAGVRRGLSFFTTGGPQPMQVATSIWLFVLGLGALVLPYGVALAALAIGFVTVAILDPLAARTGEVPAHFARLRPPQMAIFLAGLAGLALAWMRG